MAAPSRSRFVDSLERRVPVWLRDLPGANVGFRVLWPFAALLDAAVDALVRGAFASWPGMGTPSALPMVGSSRGIIRGQGETDDDYAARLRAWLDTWRSAGSAEAVARSVQTFLAARPKVRVITRSGRWVTLEEDGTVTYASAPWDWDSVSHPERAGHWSEIFVVVYGGVAARTGALGDVVPDGSALGQQISLEEVDALRGLLSTWKSCHTRIRAVIFTSDPSLYDPDDPGTCPDGTFGAWGTTGSGSRVKSGRDYTTSRHWEL